MVGFSSTLNQFLEPIHSSSIASGWAVDNRLFPQTGQAPESLYLPDPAQIKHEADDPEQQGRTHPLFENVLNQLEMAVQEIMWLRRARILVKLAESDTLLRLRTPMLPK
jgi:hypothetical protein